MIILNTAVGDAQQLNLWGERPSEGGFAPCKRPGPEPLPYDAGLDAFLSVVLGAIMHQIFGKPSQGTASAVLAGT